MDDKIIVSIFMGLEGLHAYSAFLPSIFTISTFVSDDYGIKKIREGEVIASAYLVVLSVVVSKLIKSPWPMILGLATGATMIGVYEFALARCPARNGCGDC